MCDSDEAVGEAFVQYFSDLFTAGHTSNIESYLEH